MAGHITATDRGDRTRYEISGPYDIGPRLMPSLKLPDGSRLSISATGRSSEGRVTYRWVVDDAAGKELGSAEDLSSGVGADVDVEEMFATFSDFIGAWVEAQRYPDSDNRDLFPDAMSDWAEANHEELSLLVDDDYPED